jgi:hypothetical protein
VTDDKDEKESKPAEAEKKEEKPAAASAPDVEEKDEPKKEAAAETKQEKKEEAAAKEEKKPAEKKAKKKKDPADAYRLASNNPVANAWKTFAALGLIGVVGAGVGYTQDPTRFAFSWLFGFVCVLTLAIGSMMFVMMHHITNGNWGVVVRRVAEIFGATSWVLLVLFIPVVVMRTTLFGDWLKTDDHTAKEHAANVVDDHDYELASNDQPGGPGRVFNPHGPGGAGGFRPGAPGGLRPTPPPGVPIQRASPARVAEDKAERVEHEEVMKSKRWYLSWPFFMGRLVAYFLIWTFIGWLLLKWSTEQDKTKDLALTVKLNRFAAPGIILLVLSLTFAAFDWVMSLDPTWYSTIFGVTFFASSMVCIFAMLILTFLGLRNSGVLVKEVTIEHYHDLGKLLFGWLVFWAYTSFAQFFLIWYGNIPEEVVYFHRRWDDIGGSWRIVSLVIMVFHFGLPFWLLMSRNVKRHVNWLGVGAVILLVTHAVEMYWDVMPNFPGSGYAFSPHWLDLTCFLGVGGVYLGVVLRLVAGHALIPVGDPRLVRALKFENA